MAYTAEQREEAFDNILKRVIAGEPLRRILKEMRIGINTFYLWCDRSDKYRERYARATDLRAEKIFEEILEIADDSTLDELVTEKGIQFNQEFAARSRIRIDARKWVLGKMRPTKYGDKLDITSDGEKLQMPVITGMIIKNEIASDESSNEEYDL